MNTDVETRRRRAVWRASHRGTKELDILIGKYAEAHLERMPGDELARFESFLAVPDPELQDWLLAPSGPPDAEFAEFVGAIRRFHGLA
jgi:antitoxin CptB